MTAETEHRWHDGPTESGRPVEGALTLVFYLVRIFTTRVWLFASVFVVVMTLILVRTMSSTRIYRATAEILIERDAPLLKNLESPLQEDRADSDYYNTQVRILHGVGLAEKVAVSLSTEDQERLGKPSPEAILSGLDAELLRNTRLVVISFEHQDRELAARVVNKVIDTYKTDNVQRRRAKIHELQKEMENQLKDVGKNLADSQDKLLKFYEENEMLLGDERQSALQRQMEEAGLILLREEHELSRIEGAVAKVEAAGDDIEKLYEVAISEHIYWRDESVHLEETRALAELAELQKKYQFTHPAYLAAVSRVREVQRQAKQSARVFARSVIAQRDTRHEAVEAARAKYEELRRKRLQLDSKAAEAERLRYIREANQTLHEALTLRIKEAGITSNLERTNVDDLVRARAPTTPVRPNLWTNLVIGFFGALMAAIALTLVVDRLDNTVRTTIDVEEAYDLPVLTVVPQSRVGELSGPPALACWKDEVSQMAEAFRRVRAAVLLSVRRTEGGGPLRRIIVVSPGPDEGKSITAMNLAISLAQMGERTLFIDADYYRSESHKVLGLDREKGLSTILVSDIPFQQVVQTTAIPCLDYMATGLIPPQPATLLGWTRMKWLLDEASRHYMRVVIDTPPMVAVTDATLLAPQADATLLVVREGKTSKTALHRSLQTLGRTGVKPLGFVFNGVRSGVGEFYFKYHHPTYALEPELSESGRQEQPQ